MLGLRRLVLPRNCMGSLNCDHRWKLVCQIASKTSIAATETSSVQHQLAIAIDPVCASSNEYKEFRDHLLNQVHKANYSVYTSSLPPDATLEEQLQQFDKVGVQYVVMLNERLCRRGDVDLRNIDTKLEEKVHSSSLLDKLKAYLS